MDMHYCIGTHSRGPACSSISVCFSLSLSLSSFWGDSEPRRLLKWPCVLGLHSGLSQSFYLLSEIIEAAREFQPATEIDVHHPAVHDSTHQNAAWSMVVTANLKTLVSRGGGKNRFFDFSRFSLERFCLDSEKFIIDFLKKKKL